VDNCSFVWLFVQQREQPLANWWEIDQSAAELPAWLADGYWPDGPVSYFSVKHSPLDAKKALDVLATAELREWVWRVAGFDRLQRERFPFHAPIEAWARVPTKRAAGVPPYELGVTWPRKTGRDKAESSAAKENSGTIKKVDSAKEQIINILREADGGGTVKAVCARHNLSKATYYGWKKSSAAWIWTRRGGAFAGGGERAAQPPVADQAVQIQILKEVNSKKW
jgi:putative transposase